APWQGLTALLAFIACIAATAVGADWPWAVGGALVGLAIPLTLRGPNLRCLRLRRAARCAAGTCPRLSTPFCDDPPGCPLAGNLLAQSLTSTRAAART